MKIKTDFKKYHKLLSKLRKRFRAHSESASVKEDEAEFIKIIDGLFDISWQDQRTDSTLTVNEMDDITVTPDSYPENKEPPTKNLLMTIFKKKHQVMLKFISSE